MEEKKPDWFSKLKVHSCELLLAFLLAIKPPSLLPIWQWLEQHYELLQGKASLPGKINFDLFPASKFFFNHAQDYHCRKISEMVSHQSGKTENMMMLFCWSLVESPIPSMWVMADADMTEMFAKDRLYPAIQACEPAFKLAPKERERWTKNLIQFDSMSLHLRGSNSKKKLKSSPIGRIFCDERSDWKKGSIGTLRERLTTFSNSQEISVGTPGDKNDEWHTDWKEGSQTFMHFNCLDCGHSQPFRFGRDATVLFPEKREKGGVVWPENEITKPNGRWDLEDGGAVERLARYECEKCGRLYENGEKIKLIKTVHEHHRNPAALPYHYSSSRNVLMMPWRSCSFGKVAVRFLKAVEAMKRGDLEPMKIFVTEDLGEPWEMPADRRQREGLLSCQGEYKLGDYWLDPADLSRLAPNTTLILTADRQMHFLRYVVRQWRSDGGSRLVEVGKVADLDALRAKQHELKIRDQCVWVDARGKRVSEVRQKALVCNWNLLQGEDDSHYLITDGDRKYRQGWRESQLDPGIGTSSEGRATMRVFLWSNSWFKDKLYFLFIQRRGPLWEIPDDAPSDYIAEVSANEWKEDKKSDGSIEGYFYESDVDDAADCELMQLVAADIGGLTRRYSGT